MRIELSYFVAALALLWIPLPLGLWATRNYRVGRLNRVTMPGVIKAWQNWMDLLRGGAGTYLLLHYALEPASGEPWLASRVVYLKAGILVAAVLFHTVRFGQGPMFYAPLCFLTSVTLVLSGWQSGSFAVLFAWCLAFGVKKPGFFLPALAATAALGGYFLSGLNTWLLLNLGLILLPMGLALLFNKRLLFVSREKGLSPGYRGTGVKGQTQSA